MSLFFSFVVKHNIELCVHFIPRIYFKKYIFFGMFILSQSFLYHNSFFFYFFKLSSLSKNLAQKELLKVFHEFGV